MREASEDAIAVNACTADGRLETLNEFFSSIEMCEKSLNDYLEQKKKIFPRFYFVSNQALLTILSNGNRPEVVGKYMGDCFDGISKMDWVEEAEGKPTPWKTSKGMFSKEMEYVGFEPEIKFEGAVETYLNELQDKMRNTLTHILNAAKATADNWEMEKKRHEWLEDYCAQLALVVTQIIWTEEVNRTFDEVEGGSETAMKDYLDLSIRRIGDLIDRVRHDLSKDLRTKIITIITIDVHARDVIDKFVLEKIQDPTSFAWQRQLKFKLEKRKTDEVRACYPEIADWECRYLYEYIGNCGRLVITPLTDRCYITLTQALNLIMGAAPAGPAGTGKTETTKDLGRALGIPVYVFNCSDQMNYESMAQIFMGLAQTGAWGCFDEFNRIAIEVLSVVSTQIKTVLDALRNYLADPKKKMFMFSEEEISVEKTVGFFITMNPGYAGRTELPENLKALFRSCAMVVPDIILICENMLMSEGFNTAKELSKKFMTLYDLSKSLLSKQTHYDWGLRAVKSVLRQAGGLKRQDPDLLEDLILMRALRDFNVPKIITDDIPIFLGLIDALFPELTIESQLDAELEAAVREVTVASGLQEEDGFVSKCVNMKEILDVRHSMFIIGNPGCGKSTVWKTLAKAENKLGREAIYEIIDPKAVTSDELFGWMNPKTKEWRDGVLAVIMRNMANNLEQFKESQVWKWIILDGDVDPEWIESCNTVMDDNKMLTLVSQERIRLTNSMRLVLEVSNLRNATPATVSRGGVLFINDNDIGWKPYVDSWMDQFKKNGDEIARTTFELCFRNYVSENFLDDTRNKETIAPMVEIAYIMTLTNIIDFLYNGLKENKKLADHVRDMKQADEESIKVIYEAYFVFAMMWSFGAALPQDLKQGFSNSIAAQAGKVCKFPENVNKELVFNYFYDALEGKWIHWDDHVQKFEYDEYALFDSIVVPTTDTIKNKYIMDIHVKQRKPLLYIGTAGTAKTTYLRDYFKVVDKETTVTATINFNSYTDSAALQSIMEDHVDKRAGKTFGPPPNHVLIYFMDDLNMPYVDKYGTQSPIALMRQLIDYGIMYNREALEEKKLLVDVLYTACLNPKAGSFFVDARLQRHYTVVACDVPTESVLETIYLQIVDSHLSKFDALCQKIGPKIIKATNAVFKAMVSNPALRPTAKKFHYQFNLRDYSRIIQNFTQSQPQVYKGQPDKLARLWVHECNRVYLDRLLFEKDIEIFQAAVRDGAKHLEVGSVDDLFADNNIFTSFISACGGHEPMYKEIESIDELKKVLEDKLFQYNEEVSSMNLVLFTQAMEHVCRIARIISQPSGNALLIGVGGSGKQSLSKLAAFILEAEVYRIMPNATYGMNELRVDLETMYNKAGVADAQVLFILTDSQITREEFLVYINDMLSSGWVPDMFPKDEMDVLLGKVRGPAKQNGYMDTPDQIFEYLLDKTQRNLHLALCFSPVGDAFRVRARKFPAIINCTSIDWFHEWPEDALIDVAARFMEDVEIEQQEIKEAIGLHMAFIHTSIEEANQEFLQRERRYNYTTPTSFLELINFYKTLLRKKQGAIKEQIDKLSIGLETMVQTTVQVDKLKEELETTMVKVTEEQRVTNELIQKVTTESEIAAGEQEKANAEEEQCTALATNAAGIKAEADKELSEALPAMQRAQDAVDCLDPKAIQEMKSFAKPPPACVKVATVGLILIKGEKKNYQWGNAQKMMGNPAKFLEEVKGFSGEEIDEWKLKKIDPIFAEPGFDYDSMISVSTAAANLCKWAINIIEYNTIYKKVKPLMDSAAEAEEQVKGAQEKLKEVQDIVAECNAKVADLQAELDAAVAKKEAVEAEAAALQDKLDLAERLVNGLADENKRWKENVISLGEEKMTTIGDALLSSAFVSYIAPFSAVFRDTLWKEKWLNDIIAKKIPYTEGVDPLYVLATLSDQAVWKKEGLPADRVSLENASIVTSCSRWPLMIDPQLQGIKWIREREGSDLKVIQLNQPRWINIVEDAVKNGSTLLIEGAGEEIDAMLDPLLSRAIIKKGKNQYEIKLGGAEPIEYDPKFKLYIQTKLSNPHYKPETAAQCTIINFIVTESGLEDQLLALVVQEEKPELELTKSNLVKEQNEFMITLAQLEEDLLTNLSNADPETILDNKELIESLEITKKTSQEIQEKKRIAAETEIQINESRNIYRRVAAEGSMLYFLLIQLYVVDHMYQYSLGSFTTFFFKAFEKAEQFEDGEDEKRVLALREQIRTTIYQWVSRGLFERHKQILLCQITFRLMMKKVINVDFTAKEFFFLINGPTKVEPNPQAEWLPDLSWFQIQKLIELEGFEKFDKDINEAAPRFRDWYNELEPESEKLPLDWKKLEGMLFQKLLVIRCLRPDRLTSALNNFMEKTLPEGKKYTQMDSTSGFEEVLFSSIGNSTTTTPIFFILSPGANPVKDVETVGKRLNIDMSKNFHFIALGQGQEENAMNKLELGHKEGHWVMLENIHLMPRWLPELEKKLDDFALEGSNPSFRVFLSAEPAKGIPIGILERSIKLTNEPPTGLKANMKQAFVSFRPEDFNERDNKVKTILFTLCYFHAVLIERRKFGPKGWNMKYPFSLGDLRDSAKVLQNYMDRNQGAKIPWDDLKYIFGEIMYGGHIVDDWDRKLCAGYLHYLLGEHLFDEAELLPYVEGKGISFKVPPVLPYDKYIEHIEYGLPGDSPLLFGMHSNTEIDFRTTQSLVLMKTLQELQGASGGGDDDDGPALTKNDRAAEVISKINDEVNIDGNKPNLEDITSKLGEERNPYQNVFVQECEYMCVLIENIQKSVLELQMAFRGELTMTDQMEQLMDCMFLDTVPPLWTKYAYPSTRGLTSWLDNLKHRLEQINTWKDDPSEIPKVVFLNRLFNPQSFLTAIKQKYSQDVKAALNKLYIRTDITKKMFDEVENRAKEGAYVFGFHVDGARWDMNSNQLEESEPKKPYSVVPVIHCRAFLLPETAAAKEDKTTYMCPVYATDERAKTYVFTAQLKTKSPPHRWVLGGVCCILDVEGIADAAIPDK